MTLTLSVLRCPDRATPETRRAEGGELVVGRGPGADWVLADLAEQPLLSRRHCELVFRAGAWTVTDISTNGTCLNGEVLPQQAPSRPLRDGDRLKLGAYEIEICLAPAPFMAAAAMGASAMNTPGMTAPAKAAESNPFIGNIDIYPLETPQVRLPDDFLNDLVMPPPERPPAQPDHSSPQSDVIRPPRVAASLPENWDMDAPEAMTPPAPPLPAAPPLPPLAAAPLPLSAAAPLPLRASAPPAEPSINADSLLAAFMEGAELTDLPPDPVAAMRGAGAAFRAFVHGLRLTLIARAEIKSAFRIDQTMISAGRNNPLKFAAGDDDALAALLGLGRRTGMRPDEAVAGALADIRRHELATMAALQQAVRELLDRLNPERFRAAAGGGLLPLARRAGAFDLFDAEYRKLRESLSEKLDDAFGRAFAAAYERVTAELELRTPADDAR